MAQLAFLRRTTSSSATSDSSGRASSRGIHEQAVEPVNRRLEERGAPGWLTLPPKESRQARDDQRQHRARRDARAALGVALKHDLFAIALPPPSLSDRVLIKASTVCRSSRASSGAMTTQRDGCRLVSARTARQRALRLRVAIAVDHQRQHAVARDGLATASQRARVGVAPVIIQLGFYRIRLHLPHGAGRARQCRS